ncbi:MAG: prolyl-tRNA synthetase associated domain-containing protein [Azospirillum sp.]|nr:prolyl-tRNA synthetase associated domain-containing protein [Azospirillum sp.]
MLDQPPAAPSPDHGPAAAPPTSPEQLLARLTGLGLAVTTHDHPPLHTVAESKALRGSLPGGHCKSLFLKDKKDTLWLVVALEDTAVDLKHLHTRIGSARLSFASAALLWQVLGVRPGAVTPFGLINDHAIRVSVVLERAMLLRDPLNYHPLVNHRTTAIRPGDLLAFIESCGHRPRLIDLEIDAGP